MLKFFIHWSKGNLIANIACTLTQKDLMTEKVVLDIGWLHLKKKINTKQLHRSLQNCCEIQIMTTASWIKTSIPWVFFTTRDLTCWKLALSLTKAETHIGSQESNTRRIFAVLTALGCVDSGTVTGRTGQYIRLFAFTENMQGLRKYTNGEKKFVPSKPTRLIS